MLSIVNPTIQSVFTPSNRVSITPTLLEYLQLIFQKPNPFPFSIWKNLAFPLRELSPWDSGKTRDENRTKSGSG
jgi:ABC-type phosphate transport system ATPase subunit